jgi:hypothetical protein
MVPFNILIISHFMQKRNHFRSNAMFFEIFTGAYHFSHHSPYQEIIMG